MHRRIERARRKGPRDFSQNAHLAGAESGASSFGPFEDLFSSIILARQFFGRSASSSIATVAAGWIISESFLHRAIRKGSAKRDGNGGDYFAIIGRDRVMLMFKAGTAEVGREVPVHRELANTSDGLRTFEITDNSRYAPCFGRPVDK